MKSESEGLWSRLSCAILYVCCGHRLHAGLTVSVSFLSVSMSELCCLEQTPPWRAVSWHWENISVEDHLLLLGSGKLNDFNAVNSCGIWEHLTPPEGHPAPWKIKPGILTWIHTNHFQSLSWQMIAQMANNPCRLQLATKRQAYVACDRLLAVLSSLLSVSSIHLLSSLESTRWAPKGSASTAYGLLCQNSPQRQSDRWTNRFCHLYLYFFFTFPLPSPHSASIQNSNIYCLLISGTLSCII